MLRRMIGAAALKNNVYEEVEADRSATSQALFVVVLVSLATGIGNLGSSDITGLVFGIIGAVVGWGLWAFITYFIGTRLFPTPETEADWGQLLRTLGFAWSPGILRVFGVIGSKVNLVILDFTLIWQLLAMVVAVRQALDYRSTWRAIGVVSVGFLVVFLLQNLVLALTG